MPSPNCNRRHPETIPLCVAINDNRDNRRQFLCVANAPNCAKTVWHAESTEKTFLLAQQKISGHSRKLVGKG